jgi:hypothetical protein
VNVSRAIKKLGGESTGRLLAGSVFPGSNRLIFAGISPCWHSFYIFSMGGAAQVVAHVKKLRAEGKHVVMAGDGINDAYRTLKNHQGIDPG